MKADYKLCALLFSLIVVLSSCGEKTDDWKPLIGRPAADFSFSDITGKQGSLGGLRGKVVLLRFWADWCPYCKYEMPRIDIFYQRIGHQDFEVLAVNVGQTREIIESFTAQLDLTYPMLMDQEAELADTYKVKAIPTNFLVDRGGIIREILIGEIFVKDEVMIDILKPFFPLERLLAPSKEH